MNIVTTVKNTYLAMAVTQENQTVELKDAVAVNMAVGNEAIARSYVLGTLTNKVVNISLNSQNVESIQDADEIGPLVELMMKYVPLAEKNAKANMVIAELTKLMKSIEGAPKAE